MKKVSMCVGLDSESKLWFGAVIDQDGRAIVTALPEYEPARLVQKLKRRAEALGVGVGGSWAGGREVVDALASLYKGVEASAPYRLISTSKFQEGVLRCVSKIPRGYVTSYTQVARLLGKPRGARAVGRALASNPLPLIIPCHRVVRANLTLGGYEGGSAMKREILSREGVGFSGGKVKEEFSLALGSSACRS